MTVCLMGDVMLGRGIDQLFARASDPALHEPHVRDAREYVALAEAWSGAIARPVSAGYVWGEALQELDRVRPAARIVNLETSITTSDEYWRGKGIHYRLHPANVGCLMAAQIDICTLANNHVLDYGRTGLSETLDALSSAQIQVAGAGAARAAARAPAIVERGAGRVLVYASGSEDSGVLREWAADEGRPGLDVLADLSERTAQDLCLRAQQARRPGDIVITSLHWGSNWGYEVPPEHVRFAHALVDGGVDIVFGHSSHHPRPIEIYKQRLILYGCGDFINDYEGIGGYEEYRGDLTLMYVATMDAASGALHALRLLPMHVRRMRLERASPADAAWLRDILDYISGPFGVRIDLDAHSELTAQVGGQGRMKT